MPNGEDCTFSKSKILDETIQDYPGGTWITMEGRAQKKKLT